MKFSLQTIQRYFKGKFRSDLSAGLTVGMVVIPQSWPSPPLPGLILFMALYRHHPNHHRCTLWQLSLSCHRADQPNSPGHCKRPAGLRRPARLSRICPGCGRPGWGIQASVWLLQDRQDQPLHFQFGLGWFSLSRRCADHRQPAGEPRGPDTGAFE